MQCAFRGTCETLLPSHYPWYFTYSPSLASIWPVLYCLQLQWPDSEVNSLIPCLQLQSSSWIRRRQQGVVTLTKTFRFLGQSVGQTPSPHMHEDIEQKSAWKPRSACGVWLELTKIWLQPALSGKNCAVVSHMCMLNCSSVASENLFQLATSLQVKHFPSITQEKSMALLQVLFLPFYVDSLHWHPLY